MGTHWRTPDLRERESSVFVYRNKQTSAKTRWVSYIVVRYWLHPSCRVELLGSFRIRCGWWRWSSWVFCGLAGYGGDVLELEHVSNFCLMWFVLGEGLGICLYKVSEGSICTWPQRRSRVLVWHLPIVLSIHCCKLGRLLSSCFGHIGTIEEGAWAQKPADTKFDAIESCKYTSEARQAEALSPLSSHIFFYAVDKINEREQQCFSWWIQGAL